MMLLNLETRGGETKKGARAVREGLHRDTPSSRSDKNVYSMSILLLLFLLKRNEFFVGMLK